jgi:hypothetical protein
MRHYNNLGPVIAYKKQPKPVFSADRQAFNEFFCAMKTFFDSMTPEQREFLAQCKGVEKMGDAYEKASDLFFQQ